MRTKTELSLSSKLHRVIHRMTVLSQTSAIICLRIHRPHIHANPITGTAGDHAPGIQLSRVTKIQGGDLPCLKG